MIRNVVVLFIMLCMTSQVYSQTTTRKPADVVKNAENAGSVFQDVNLFTLDDETRRDDIGLKSSIRDFNLLDMDVSSLKALVLTQPEAMQFNIPTSFQRDIELELVQVDILSHDFSIVRRSDNREVDIVPGVHYRGIIKGSNNSIAAISFFENEIMGLISSDMGNLVIGKINDDTFQGKHIIYDDRDVIRELGLDCGTMDDGIGYKDKDLTFEDNNRDVGDCIRLYMEVDYDIYNDKGGVTGAANYVTGLMNEVITLYANENIAAVVSQLVVWDVPSPYSSSSSSGMLSDFQANISSINGDLGQLLSYQASGGIAAGFNGICNSNVDNSLSFSSINSSYATVPTYSWSVMVVTHEFGHLWGSRHTHACVWNGNNTAIDGCAGQTEGSCPLPGFPPQGGTIMSYCHLQNVGINLSEGFGPQPGNVIRNTVANASCTSSCGPPSCTDGIQNGEETGVDCGGPDCPACPSCDDGVQNGEETGVDCGGPDCPACPCYDNGVTLTINLDNYPEETSWAITSGSTAWASGGTYGSQPDGSTVVELACLPDGCYEFNIFDAYGDGICCGYGQGDYQLVDDSDGSVLASGGAFGSSETTIFCVSSTGPSCTDGVQNGDETGVDCGGPDCPACPTCDDGVQNGGETGVDCGGPDCPACPTCSDGIQNGQETGVDCGGPDCPPCSSCNNGVQDGDETGVDCGGPDCPACPTCDDGIQNGEETGVDCGGPDCPPCSCSENGVTLSINLDNYPEETSWEITSGSTTWASGGTYGSQPDGATVIEVACLPDGCYDFTIYDSYGDGICCGYGQGEYELTDDSDGSIHASGGSFGSSETTNFCLGGNGPTCDDGIQNGEETGVDCGGPDCPPCPEACTYELIDFNNFNSSWGIWNDGGSDCRRSANDAAYASGGTGRPVRLRDNTNSSTMTTDDLDLTAYDEITVDFYYYARSMDNSNEDFWLQISTNGGGSYTTVEEWNQGDEFENDNSYLDAVVIQGPFTSSTRLRFRCDASGNSDWIYIDDVEITGCNSGAALPGGPIDQKEDVNLDPITLLSKLKVFPNPVRQNLTLSFDLSVAAEVHLIVTDFNGRVVSKDQLECQSGQLRSELDVSAYAPGIYVVHLLTSHARISEKIVVIK